MRPYGNRSGHKETKFERREIIAWDGEGINLDNGKHVYALFANSLGEFRINAGGLSSFDCFQLLLKTFADHPRAIHIIFGGSYDFGMMLFASLPFKKVRDIWKQVNEYGTRWKEYAIKYLPRKHLSLREFGYPPFICKKPNVVARGILWDVFPFFQTSFIRAIREWLGPDYQDLQIIEQGKALRGQFTEAQLKNFVLPYTQAELRALVLLYNKLLDSVQEADMKLSRHDGPGALASYLMKSNGIKEKKKQETPELERAFAHGFFGGRVELLKYGRCGGQNRPLHPTDVSAKGEIYNYDINSAYPYAMLSLPNLSEGHWTREPVDSCFSISLVEWNFKKQVPFYPFPFREKQGNVLFPPEGRNWIWKPEIDMAKFYGFDKDFKILETQSFVPNDPADKPFDFIREKFEKRRQWKLEKNPAEKAMKLAINSLYGKTCQQVGYDAKTGRKPPYHSFAWAGFITSYTRAKVTAAGLQNPGAIIFFATDGIYSTELLNLDIGNELGHWTYKLCDEVVSIQSGVYFVRQGDKWFAKSRGFDSDLKPERVLEAWLKNQTEAYFPSTTFQGVGRSTVNEETWNNRGNWITIDRRLSLSPWGTKRLDLHGGKVPLWAMGRGLNPANGLVDTTAASSLDGYLTGGVPVSAIKKLLWQLEDEGFQFELEHQDSFL